VFCSCTVARSAHRCSSQLSEYVLGVFDANATDEAQAERDAAGEGEEEPGAQQFNRCTHLQHTVQRVSRPPPHSFHAHQFTGGTPCDLTSARRSTEVRFVCPPESASASGAVGGEPGLLSAAQPAAHFIESVHEPTTCHYVLTFSTPLLCSHPRFRVQEPPVAHIRCTLLPPQAQPEGEGEAVATGSVAAAGSAHEEL